MPNAWTQGLRGPCSGRKKPRERRAHSDVAGQLADGQRGIGGGAGKVLSRRAKGHRAGLEQVVAGQGGQQPRVRGHACAGQACSPGNTHLLVFLQAHAATLGAGRTAITPTHRRSVNWEVCMVPAQHGSFTRNVRNKRADQASGALPYPCPNADAPTAAPQQTVPARSKHSLRLAQLADSLYC